MKINFGILLVAGQVATVFSATVPDGVVECGALGVMSYTADGIVAADVRKCANHPLNRDRFSGDFSLAPLNAVERDLDPEASSLIAGRGDGCYFGAPYGCSDGYCWKSCGPNGEWCWTAEGDGSGPWLRCSSYTNCDTLSSYGEGCGNACGCSC